MSWQQPKLACLPAQLLASARRAVFNARFSLSVHRRSCTWEGGGERVIFVQMVGRPLVAGNRRPTYRPNALAPPCLLTS